jgi:surface carbohydrate biosynthesis protein (TIGR04326 family)
VEVLPSILLWDSELDPTATAGLTVLWARLVEDGQRMISLPRLVERNADRLRARYLAWIFDFGSAKIGEKSVIGQLSIRPGFSYWWMTQLAEKSYGKSPRLYDAIRLLALEDLARQYGVRRISVVTADNVLQEVIETWGHRAGIEIEVQRIVGDRNTAPNARLWDRLPLPMKAFATLVRYLTQHWPLSRNSGVPLPASSITIFDYLFHLPSVALTGGGYASGYWTNLVDLLRDSATPVKWLHHFVKHEAVPGSHTARRLISEFNRQDADHGQVHATWDTELSLLVVARAILDYLGIVRRGLRLRTVRSLFTPEASQLDFWPLFKSDWQTSLYGSTAIINCLHLNIFENILARAPHQQYGVYLLENQGWEAALLHAWRAAGHGQLIGVPHTTVRFWDLRYFFDPRSYQEGGVPMPDRVAVNGPAAMSAYREGGFPMSRVVEVEALRYQYLEGMGPDDSPSMQRPAGGKTVLVLGDFLPTVTARQMEWLVDAATGVPEARYIIKPHPNCPVHAEEYPSLNMIVCDELLSELLPRCDVVYTSNITSAAVDAYCFGIPVVSMLDGAMLDLSPLRGFALHVQVSNPAELAAALRLPSLHGQSAQRIYFRVDRTLPRWRRLLGLQSVGGNDTAG